MSLLVLVVLAGALAVALGVVFRGGISARTDPSRVEAAVALRVRNFLIPRSARDAKNPVPAGSEALAEGRAHFASHCASCHANDGSGRTEMGRGLYPRAPDMRSARTQRLTDGELFYLIENGIRFTGMPAWGVEGRPEESWKLVHFIRRLPGLGPEEVAEMEGQNPRSPAEWRELEEDDEFLHGGAAEGEAHGHH